MSGRAAISRSGGRRAVRRALGGTAVLRSRAGVGRSGGSAMGLLQHQNVVYWCVVQIFGVLFLNPDYAPLRWADVGRALGDLAGGPARGLSGAQSALVFVF